MSAKNESAKLVFKGKVRNWTDRKTGQMGTSTDYAGFIEWKGQLIIVSFQGDADGKVPVYEGKSGDSLVYGRVTIVTHPQQRNLKTGGGRR